LIDDGQFHQYTFSLTTFAGLSSGFQNDVSINSILLTGTGTAAFELDDVEYNETGVVPEPTLLAVPLAGMLALRRRRRSK
jgi:hypothetical protein